MPNHRKRRLAPDALPQRPTLKHNNWESLGERYTLDSVAVKHSTSGKAHTYVAPMGDSVIARRLRRYTLTLARYEMPDENKYAKRWAVPAQCVEAASRLVANICHTSAYDDDPSIDTVNVKPLIDALSTESPSPFAFYQAAALYGTKAMEEIMVGVTNLDVKIVLAEFVKRMDYASGYSVLNVIRHYINSNVDWRRRRAVKEYKWIAQQIAMSADEAHHATDRRKGTEEAERAKRRLGEATGRKPDLTECSDQWAEFVLAKPDLTVSHTGKLGRKIIACDTGKEPRYISRVVTDPDKRIFSRKTRSLGGVVVIDASGSMAWDDKALMEVMSCAAGSTVLMYSDGDGEGQPNAWVVARQGRMVRRLPDAPGGNGVDGPALVYAAKYLRTRRSLPIIWVSDGAVTGKGDSSSYDLRKEIAQLCRTYNIVRVEHYQEAVAMLKRLQGGMR
jgi:hypothetical protein